MYMYRDIESLYLGLAHVFQWLFHVLRGSCRVSRWRQTAPHTHTHLCTKVIIIHLPSIKCLINPKLNIRRSCRIFLLYRTSCRTLEAMVCSRLTKHVSSSQCKQVSIRSGIQKNIRKNARCAIDTREGHHQQGEKIKHHSDITKNKKEIGSSHSHAGLNY